MTQHHAFDLTVPVDHTDHAVGRIDAAATLVEYGDFECPNCKQAAPAVKLLLKRFPDRIRVVYRHFPLEGVHPHAVQAAEAAEIAGAQGRFWAMHDLLFENQAHLKLPQLRAYAEQLSLDMPRYQFEMEDHVYLQRIREHLKNGSESGVRGTPTFFVNGRLQDVSFGLTALFDAVEGVLK